MTTNYTTPGAPEHIRADIEQSRADLGDTVTALTGKVDPQTRVRGALSSVRSRTASGVASVRAQAPRVGRAVRNRPVPVAAGALALAAAVTGLVLGRRAAKARSARGRRLPAFLRR
ncbi:DUF3618 domain-containing protein [Actinoplanes sp. KI2]|uniref:DUF3618 domain-containing protein n=1 Tax=Actinoplanes sp. KI2 TaxID=2983315 RepID=UPI0021D60320|nr:DUF3618 domain-containing protein [Actinoplanes sp. KI2]MCU7730055.1 DUF3618 domain-containing protein [Actinoplanes sp. KI2]